MNHLAQLRAGRIDFDPRRHRRGRPRRDSDREAPGARDFRDGRYAGEAGAAHIDGRLARHELAHPRLRRRNHGDHRRPGGRRRAQLARRRLHPEEPLCAGAVRPLPRDRQGRHLPELEARPATPSRQHLVLRHRPDATPSLQAGFRRADVRGDPAALRTRRLPADCLYRPSRSQRSSTPSDSWPRANTSARTC